MPKKDVINKVDKVIPTGDLQLAKKTKNKQQTRGDLATHGMDSNSDADELVVEDYNANDGSCSNLLTRNVPVSPLGICSERRLSPRKLTNIGLPLNTMPTPKPTIGSFSVRNKETTVVRHKLGLTSSKSGVVQVVTGSALNRSEDNRPVVPVVTNAARPVDPVVTNAAISGKKKVVPGKKKGTTKGIFLFILVLSIFAS